MKKGMLFSLCFIFFIITVSMSAFASGAAEKEGVPISHGIRVLAERGSMVLAGVKGSAISFEEEDFARAMNLSRIDSITVTKIPPVTEGELLVGSTVVNAGQTISGKNLRYLRYEHKSDINSTSSFRFKVGESDYDLRCSLFMLDTVNHAPTLSVATETVLDVSTHRNIMLYGTLPCYDTDGDRTTIEIVSYPKKGSIILNDAGRGEYTYLPSEDFTGKDSFCYVAVDEYGSYSAKRRVNLEVKAPKVSVVYADMLSAKEYNAAITVTEEGIMSGARVGDNIYFYPNNTVTRAEFIVMAMKSIGINSVSDTTESVFFDHSDIPENMRGYINTAYELGYVNGSYVDGKLCFSPNEAITRAEAAVMICNMIDMPTPTVAPVFEDSDDIPAFAETAVNSLTYMGALDTDNGNIAACEPITRAKTAELLATVMRIAE